MYNTQQKLKGNLMATETHAETETNIIIIDTTLYARLPAEAKTWLGLTPEKQQLRLGLATGKHGKFIWLSKTDQKNENE